MIMLPSIGYHDGRRLDRAEIADLIAVEVGVLSVEDSIRRQRRRMSGEHCEDITPFVKERLKRHRL